MYRTKPVLPFGYQPSKCILKEPVTEDMYVRDCMDCYGLGFNSGREEKKPHTHMK